MTHAAARMAAEHSVLVLVDYQPRLMPAIAGGDAVLAEALRLADVAGLLGVRTVGTEQNPERLGRLVESLRAQCATVVAKMHFDACTDGLRDVLRPPGAAAQPDVVIAGCEAHVCLLQTALGLLRAGYRVWVVEGACGSRSPRDVEWAMSRLERAGAVVVTAEMTIFEWLDSCRHPRFSAVLQRVKEKAKVAFRSSAPIGSGERNTAPNGEA